MCQPAVAIVGIIFGSLILGLALTYIFCLLKVHSDRKWKGARCNGNCQCRGTKPDEESGVELPPYNDSHSTSGTSVSASTRAGPSQEDIRLLDDDPLSKN